MYNYKFLSLPFYSIIFNQNTSFCDKNSIISLSPISKYKYIFKIISFKPKFYKNARMDKNGTNGHF